MTLKQIYVIEHLEPELWPWCIIEYKHISKIVGRDSIWFTNIRGRDAGKLKNFGRVFNESVKEMKLSGTAVLDPESDELLTPAKAKTARFFIFGGILGDNPPRRRTEPELTRFLPGAKAYNIGKEQMSTDNAVYVVHKIAGGTSFDDISFQDSVEIQIDETESTILPYRYALVKGKPLMSPELIRFLNKQDKVFSLK